MKKISLLLALLMIISVFNPNVLAYEGEKREKEVIKVGEISVVSPYRLKEVEVKHYEDDNFYYANVYSLKDNKLLISYKEEKPQEITLMKCGEETIRDLFTTYHDNPVDITVRAECVVYNECGSTGTVMHLIKINSADHYISSSGYFTLNNKKSTVSGNQVQVSGTQEIDYDNSITQGLSLSFLESVGFSIESQTGTVYHLRRTYHHTVEFR